MEFKWPSDGRPIRENPRTPGGKKVPTRYLKGLTKLERMIAEDEIDKGYEYDTDDPEAYKFWKSDIKATARGLKIGPSKHKEEYYRRYRKNIDPDYKPSGNTPKRKFVNRITKETGIKRSLIEKVYNKGLAAWRTGHRPGVQQHQWAAGRVYAFAVGADSSTAPGKPDHSLAVEAGVRKNPKVPFEVYEGEKLPMPLKSGITIYGAAWCQPCQLAKEFCMERGFEGAYVEIQDIGGKPTKYYADFKAKVLPLTDNYRYIPVIFDNGEFLEGGYSTLYERYKEKPLRRHHS